MKKYIILLISFAILLSCDSSSGDLDPSDSDDGLDVRRTVSIISSDTEIRGKIGSKIQLEFEEINISLGGNGYTWSSSDESIITVDQNGVVTAIAFGAAMIKITSVDDDTITDEVAVNVIDIETYYLVENTQNNTTLTSVGGVLNTSATNPNITTVFNSTNVIKFERGISAFSFLRFTSPRKIDFDNPDSKISFWAYIEDGGNNGLTPPNNQLRVIARTQAGTGANQAATPVQEIVGFNKWHEYTFDLKDVLVSGVDYYQIYIFCAPADNGNNAQGTIYYIDNIRGPFLQ